MKSGKQNSIAEQGQCTGLVASENRRGSFKLLVRENKEFENSRGDTMKHYDIEEIEHTFRQEYRQHKLERGHVGSLVLLKPIREGKLEQEEPEEAEARREFIRQYMLGQECGPLAEIGDKECVVRLHIRRIYGTGTRTIAVTVTAEPVRRHSFGKLLWLEQTPSEDSNAFLSHDFLKHHPRYPGVGFAMQKLQAKMKRRCLIWDCCSTLSAERRQELQAEILLLHDALREMRQQQQDRIARKTWQLLYGKERKRGGRLGPGGVPGLSSQSEDRLSGQERVKTIGGI